jgi:hypothetical protein
MEDVEPYLVELIKKLAAMSTPITTSQGLELLKLANFLIEGQSTEQKTKYFHGYKFNGCAKLGKTYWKNFLKRNNHFIRLKETVKFDSRRSDLWRSC